MQLAPTHRKHKSCRALVGLFLLASITFASASSALDVSSLYRSAGPSVVLVLSYDANDEVPATGRPNVVEYPQAPIVRRSFELQTSVRSLR